MAARWLISAAGEKTPERLSAADVIEAVHGYEAYGYAHGSKVGISRCLRRILLNLWEYHHAPKLNHLVPSLTNTRPRNVIASRAEVDAILDAASPSLRLFLLLCSDMALRSGTANAISGSQYVATTGTLRFNSKAQSRQALPVTAEIRAILDPLDHLSPIPYVWQLRIAEHRIGPKPTVYCSDLLRTELKKLCKSLGIQKRIIPHDLRRTTAVAVYNQTQDLRVVKALLGHTDMKTTLWYLDHDLTPVSVNVLERAKKPFLVSRKKEQTG